MIVLVQFLYNSLMLKLGEFDANIIARLLIRISNDVPEILQYGRYE